MGAPDGLWPPAGCARSGLPFRNRGRCPQCLTLTRFIGGACFAFGLTPRGLRVGCFLGKTKRPQSIRLCCFGLLSLGKLVVGGLSVALALPDLAEAVVGLAPSFFRSQCR